MKIITNTKFSGKLCYVQVKDLLFLARYTGNKRLMQDYINTINNGKSDDEFIKVSGDSYIRAFELCDYIIDFSEYSRRDIGVNYLANMIKTKAYAMPREKRDQEGLDLQIDAVRDIISYKRGELGYKIPLVPNGKVEMMDKTHKYVFESTIIDDCFVLKAVDGSSVEGKDYERFLNDTLKSIFDTLYPDCTERTYNSFISGNSLVITIKRNEVKKKKGVVGKILAKIKKED